MVNVGPDTAGAAPAAAPLPLAAPDAPAPEAAAVAAAPIDGFFSVNLPIFSKRAGGRPLIAGPVFVIDAAATDGEVPGGT
jgi:hypothetical protein